MSRKTPKKKVLISKSNEIFPHPLKNVRIQQKEKKKKLKNSISIRPIKIIHEIMSQVMWKSLWRKNPLTIHSFIHSQLHFPMWFDIEFDQAENLVLFCCLSSSSARSFLVLSEPPIRYSSHVKCCVDVKNKRLRELGSRNIFGDGKILLRWEMCCWVEQEKSK